MQVKLSVQIGQESAAEQGFSNNIYPFGQDERRGKIEDWLLVQRPIVVSPHEITEIGKRRLTAEEWCMIEESPGDYWPIAFAKGMNGEQQNKFIRFNPRDDRGFAHYMNMQSAWGAVGIKLFYDEKRRMPDCRERNEIAVSFSGEFRVFHALKTLALQERVDYPWADEVIDRYHKNDLVYIHG